MTALRNGYSDDLYSDDENASFTQDRYGASQKTIQETKGWNVFDDPPIKKESGSMANQECLELTMKILKVCAYLITFMIVLASGVISKGTLLFMTSHISPKKVLSYCNKDFGRDKQFIVRLPDAERVAWMWCLMFAFMVPEVGTLIRSLRICYFKSWKKPSFVHFLIVWLAETMHTIGLALLVYSVLPEMDVVKGAMLSNCVCFVPAVMGLLSRSKQDSKRFIKVVIDMLAIAAQATGFVVWPLVEGKAELWLTPIAIFLISAGWWENFVSEQSPLPFIKILGKMKQDLNQSRYFMYVFISIWKMLCFFCATCVIIWIQEESVSHFFTEFSNGFGAHAITIEEIKPVLGGPSLPDISELIPTGDDVTVRAHDMTPIYVLLINVFTTYLVYIFGKFACKIMIQGFSYAFPVNLTIPVSISLLIAFCGLRNGDPCYFRDIFPGYLFFQSPPMFFLNDFISKQYAWIWLLWLLSQTWITLHIWTPNCTRLSSTEKLFVSPLYNSFLIDQSMALNRRRGAQEDVKTEDLDEIQRETDDDNYATISNVVGAADPSNNIRSSDSITRIYICATMWHENKDEMIEFLKSIMRMDEDQCARRLLQKNLQVLDPDYYELETHIFFDDAFEISDHSVNDRQLNKFVKLLMNTMDEAATEVHQTHLRVGAPTKYPTAYGGRLVWTLPGKTKMIAHLKDKTKIRPKKRWSQVMYMYYLLGHRLMERNITVDRKDVIAENTFLLALDGDIDFHPHAVQLLVDLMKRNKGLGAACGRIHPVGSGPMVWYQMFEYAIGHWLQKATEHMIGCVLCSPGCFSLFRAKALMEDNVMKKYTTTATEPKHYVQYDQGEDRWLCTLMLQQGYRVEYSAASDAYTHAPEGFNEFYNQRRRWVPSTIANILDLLQDAKRTIKRNDNISRLYIAYQILLMAGTILGPGTIFLMLVGAFVAAFQIDNWTSFTYNLIPILLFMFVCFTCKSEIQLKVAALISAIYGLIMMAVLVGIMLQINNDGILAPSSLFLFLVAGEMIVTALLHPQELYCLPAGIVYYVTVPSMYLLLILYSIFNMNIISWGTREVATKKTKEELEKDKKDAEEAKKKAKQKTLLGFLQGGNGTDNDDEGSIELSLAGLFKCMCCTHKKNDEDKIQLMHIAESLEAIKKQIGPNPPMSRRRSFSIASREHSLDKVQEEPIEEDMESTASDSGTTSTATKDERDDTVSPYWMDDPDLKKGDVDYLSSPETKFWQDILDEYLFPIDEDKEEQARIAKELKDLRDKCVFAFFMINALFVLIVFLLTLKKDLLHIKWPFGVKTNITYEESLQEVHITKEYLQLEPIGLVFVFFFALILVIQFTAMLFHRFGTISHILASTQLNFYCTKKAEDLSPNALLKKHGVNIVKKLQQLRGIDDPDVDNNSKCGPNRIGRRKTVHKLVESAERKRRGGQIITLDEAFARRLSELDKNEQNSEDNPVLRRVTKSKEMMNAFKNRRNTVIEDRRRSQMHIFGGANSDYSGVSQLRSQRNSTMSVQDTRGQRNVAFEDDEDPYSIEMQPMNNNWNTNNS